MKKSINQGTTLFVVTGSSRKDAQMKLLYVNKKAIEKVEEEHFYSKYIGTKTAEISQEDIDNADGMQKLLMMSGGLNRTIHIQEQGINKIIMPHTVVYDREGNRFDVSENDNRARYFRSRKKANIHFRKLMKRSGLVMVDESASFFQNVAI